MSEIFDRKFFLFPRTRIVRICSCASNDLGFYLVQHTVTTSTRCDSGGGSGGRDSRRKFTRNLVRARISSHAKYYRVDVAATTICFSKANNMRNAHVSVDRCAREVRACALNAKLVLISNKRGYHLAFSFSLWPYVSVFVRVSSFKLCKRVFRKNITIKKCRRIENRQKYYR